MKNLFLLTTLTMASGAFAAPDFSVLGEAPEYMGRVEKMQECIKAGWQAAHPTDEQNQAAGEYLKSAHGVVRQNMKAIKEAARGVWIEFAKHPITKADVDTAEGKLQVPVKLVRTTVRDAIIDSLNLLTNEQRDQYDQAFMACIKE